MKSHLFVPLLILASSTLRATETVTWEAAVLETSLKNPQYQAAVQSLKSAGYLSNVAKGNYLPTLSGDMTYRYSDQSDARYGAGLTLSQNIFRGFMDSAGIEQALAREVQASENLRSVKAELSFNLKKAYEGLLYAQNNKVLTQEIMRRREDNLRLVGLRYETGRENKGSVMLSQAYFAQAKYENLQATLSLQISQAELLSTLGRESTGEVAVEGNIPESVPEETPNFQELLLNTPEYKIIRARKDEAKAGVKSARSTFFPKLDVSGGVTRESRAFIAQDNGWFVGAAMTFPFFNGMKDYYSLKSSKSLWSESTHDERNLFLLLLPRLRQSYANFLQSLEKVNVDRAFMDATKVRSEIARSKYNNGLLSFEDWDIIENDLISRQKSYLQTKFDRVLSQAAWEQIKGEAVLR